MGWFDRLTVSPREINDVLPLMAEALLEVLRKDDDFKKQVQAQLALEVEKHEAQLQNLIYLIRPQVLERNLENEAGTELLAVSTSFRSDNQSVKKVKIIEQEFSQLAYRKINEKFPKLSGLIEDLTPTERLQFFYDWLENCKENRYPRTDLQVWSLRALSLGVGIGTFAAIIGATSATVSILGLAFPPALAVGATLGLIAAGLVLWGVYVKRGNNQIAKEMTQYRETETKIKEILATPLPPTAEAEISLNVESVADPEEKKFNLLDQLRKDHLRLRQELGALPPEQLLEVAREIREEQDEITRELAARVQRNN